MQIQGFRLAACTALLALVSSACTSYGFARQDIGLRHDAESDAVELMVVSHDLLETSASSAATLAEVAAGKRLVILVDWPFEFPLDQMEDSLRDSADPLAPRALAFLQGIAVEEAGVWAGPEGERSLYQRLSIPHASQGLALINEWINRTSLEQETGESIARKWGPRTGELFEAHVRAGKSWLALEQGALVLRAPLGPDGAARALEELLREVKGEEGDASLLWLAEALTAFSVADGVATLTFGPGEDGWIRLRPVPTPAAVEKRWAPAQGAPLPAEPPPGIARFLAGGH